LFSSSPAPLRPLVMLLSRSALQSPMSTFRKLQGFVSRNPAQAISRTVSLKAIARRTFCAPLSRMNISFCSFSAFVVVSVIMASPPKRLQEMRCARSKGSRITSRPRRDSSESNRLAARSKCTASRRLSRVSFTVAPWVFAPGNSSTNPMKPSGTF